MDVWLLSLGRDNKKTQKRADADNFSHGNIRLVIKESTAHVVATSQNNILLLNCMS